MLSSFQNEWDSLALEVFSLRKQLHKARSELSAALYHNDAAVRVAARAIRERDEAKLALEELSIAIGNGSGPVLREIEMENGKINSEEDTSTEALPADAISRARAELFQLHKSQKPTLSIPAASEICIANNDKSIAHPFKKASTSFYRDNLLVGSPTGALAIISNLGSETDPVVVKYSKSAHKGMDVVSLSTVLDGTPIAYHLNGDLIIGDNDSKFQHVHKKIASILTHPSLRNLFVLVGNDSTWSLNDVTTSKTLFHNDTAQEASQNLAVSDIHVDGALLGIGLSGSVIIYDLTTGKPISTIKTKHHTINKIKFAMNGYWLVLTSSNELENSLEIIDLRKSTTIHSISSSTPFTDFIIDPTSSIIICLNLNSELNLHRYVKKGKSWHNDALQLITDFSLISLEMVSTSELEHLQQGILKFLGISESSNIIEFQVSESTKA